MDDKQMESEDSEGDYTANMYLVPNTMTYSPQEREKMEVERANNVINSQLLQINFGGGYQRTLGKQS